MKALDILERSLHFLLERRNWETLGKWEVTARVARAWSGSSGLGVIQ